MSRVKLFLLTTASLFCLLLLLTPVSGQTKPEAKPETKPDQGDTQDVIKFDTSLVQTDVMVFDKNGRFVDGLKPEQFQLKIDKTPRDISFFEMVRSGRVTRQREETAQPNPSGDPKPVNPPPKSDAQRRSVIFFVDDLHLAPDSLVRTRKALLEFIDRGIGEGDLVAITSPSGQIGFLQQFTADRNALRSAVARLNYRNNPKLDMEKPPMSEFIAMKIREGDQQALSYFVQEVYKQNCFTAGTAGVICSVTPEAARQQVKMRAQQMMVQSAPATDDTLRLLEGLMRSAAQLPGRKVVFVISDGFFLTDRKYGAIDRIRKVTEAAGRAGVVIYTLDARGLVTESLDVTNNKPIEPGGLLNGASIGEIAATQDGLNALAKDTGGQAFRNTNQPMFEWVEKVMDETSNYYLLAWKPDTDEQKRGKFKDIEVSIVGRPDLKVRARTSYFKSAALPLLTTKKKSSKDTAHAREDDMRPLIDAPVAQREIPTEVDLRFVQMPGLGTRVVATITIDESTLSFDMIDGKLAADVDIGGICYDDKGKPIDSFVGRLRIFPRSPNAANSGGTAPQKKRSIYQFTTLVPGGLYQVRVGIRDLKSSRIGSAMDFITVPKI
jgi:VWFA-related protein